MYGEALDDFAGSFLKARHMLMSWQEMVMYDDFTKVLLFLLARIVGHLMGQPMTFGPRNLWPTSFDGISWENIQYLRWLNEFDVF